MHVNNFGYSESVNVLTESLSDASQSSCRKCYKSFAYVFLGSAIVFQSIRVCLTGWTLTAELPEVAVPVPVPVPEVPVPVEDAAEEAAEDDRRRRALRAVPVPVPVPEVPVPVEDAAEGTAEHERTRRALRAVRMQKIMHVHCMYMCMDR